jgi:hypothetical protein
VIVADYCAFLNESLIEVLFFFNSIINTLPLIVIVVPDSKVKQLTQPPTVPISEQRKFQRLGATP